MSTKEISKDLYQQLLAFLLKRVRDEQIAQDLLQEAFLKWLRKAEQIRDPDKMLAYLYQIIRNNLNDYFRSLKPEYSSENLKVEDPDEDHIVLNKAFAQSIPHLIQELPEPFRSVLWEVEIRGKSQKELAAQLEIPYSTLKSRVQKARELLREQILACCTIQVDAYGNIMDYYKNPEPQNKCGSC